MSSSNRQNTTAGAAVEGDRLGTFQDKTHDYTRERHPSSVNKLLAKPSKYIMQTTYVEPQGTVSQFAGSEVRYTVPKCNGYLWNVSLAGVVTPVTTTQTDPRFISDTCCYKDDAWFMMLENVRMELGCEQISFKEEDGQIFIYKYNHHYNGDQRLGKSVNDGSLLDRIRWARREQQIRVPLLFDVFSHPSKALRVWTMEDSPVKFTIRLRPMNYMLECLGAANDGTGAPTAGFAAGQIRDLTLACHFLQLPVWDAQRLERNAPKRVTYVREWCRYRAIPHLSSTTRETIDLQVQNSMEQIVIFSKLDRYHANPSAAVPPNGDLLLDLALQPNVQYPFVFAGEATLDGTAYTTRDPFAGAELRLDGNLRFAHSYDEMTTWVHAHQFARNPSDITEKVPTFVTHDHPMSPLPGPSIQMSQINHKKLDLFWNFNGVQTTNWNGTLDVYVSVLNVLVTDSHRAQLVYPN